MSNGRLKHRIFIGITPVIDPPIPAKYWLLENGDRILLENGDLTITEDS
jgi:hypothetical protein